MAADPFAYLLAKTMNSEIKICDKWKTTNIPNLSSLKPRTKRCRLMFVFQDETVWLTQKLMAELFQTSVPNINMHLKNIFEEGELEENRTIKEFLIVQQEGKREIKRKQVFYNLDAIISAGYRIKSHIATKFRQWATKTWQRVWLPNADRQTERKNASREHCISVMQAKVLNRNEMNINKYKAKPKVKCF